MTPGEWLHVDFRKWPEKLHWHFDVHFLGDDEHGSWFCLPAGGIVQRGEEPAEPYPYTSALLFRDQAWWVSYWTNSQHRYPLYIDVSTPPRWEPGRVQLVDLDLDVVRTQDRAVDIIDRDEFELHQRELDYPAELIEGAEETAQMLAEAVRRGEEPFGDVGEQWLERALASAGKASGA